MACAMREKFNKTWFSYKNNFISILFCILIWNLILRELLIEIYYNFVCTWILLMSIYYDFVLYELLNKYIIMVNINGYFYYCVSTWNTIEYEIWSLWIDINEYLLWFLYETVGIKFISQQWALAPMRGPVITGSEDMARGLPA